MLHFISHEEDAPGIIAKFRERLAPGSYLAVSVGTSDGADPEMLAEATQTYAGARMPFTLRSRAQILDLFDGFDLVEPGLVSLPEWRPAFNTDRTPAQGTHRRCGRSAEEVTPASAGRPSRARTRPASVTTRRLS